MIDYIYGTIKEVSYDSLIVEANGIGYTLVISNPSGFNVGEIKKVYTFLQVKEDAFVLFGFKAKDERELFLKLIGVSGLGPKTVSGMFANVNAAQLIQAIETSNTSFLKKLPGIGPKAAQQIILDLKGKLVLDVNDKSDVMKTNQELLDTKEALKSLGFKSGEIDNVLSKIGNTKASSEEYLRQALKMLRKG